MTGEAFVALVRSRRFRWSGEEDLRDGLEAVLREEGVAHERECVLGPKDRIDFLVDGGLGVEVKVARGVSAITRQLHRYAQHERIAALVLFTTSARLPLLLPPSLNGKPILSASLDGGSF